MTPQIVIEILYFSYNSINITGDSNITSIIIITIGSNSTLLYSGLEDYDTLICDWNIMIFSCNDSISITNAGNTNDSNNDCEYLPIYDIITFKSKGLWWFELWLKYHNYDGYNDYCICIINNTDEYLNGLWWLYHYK